MRQGQRKSTDEDTYAGQGGAFAGAPAVVATTMVAGAGPAAAEDSFGFGYADITGSKAGAPPVTR